MCVYHFVVFVYNMGASFMDFMFFLATRQLYFSCIVEYYILIYTATNEQYRVKG